MANIVKIIAVRDTRAYEEQGDRWVPIPGSGNHRTCDRCGRDHEVHVDVELSDGRVACIGQGCARGDSMEVAVRSAVTSEITRARLAGQHAGLLARLAQAQGVMREVDGLDLPPIELVSETVDHPARGDRRVYRMGDTEVWTLPGQAFNAERRQALIRHWRYNQCRLLMPTFDYPEIFETWASGLVKRVRAAERRVASRIVADMTSVSV